MVTSTYSIPLPGRTFSHVPLRTDAPVPPRPLDEFVTGPEQSVLRSVIVGMLATIPTDFNPLVLCGASGTGKSHLAQGLAAHWRKHLPPGSVVVVAAADFVEEHAEAAQTRTMDDLRAKYRRAELLVFENLHHLAAKSSWKHVEAQQELIRTCDALVDAGSQLILTCDRTSSGMTGLDRRLRSRLAAGLTLVLETPCEATRAAVLARLAAARGLELDAEIQRLLAARLRSTVPALVEALLRLEQSSQGAIDAELVAEFLAQRERLRRPTINVVAVATARHFSIRLDALRGPSRTRAVVQARNVAIYLVREMTGATLEEIGQYFGRRDHTTVMHSLKRIDELSHSDAATRQSLGALREKLQG